MNPKEIIKKHDDYRLETLNMQASENYLSSEVRKGLASDMASRYSMVFDQEVHGVFVHNAYGGTRYQEEITECAESKARDVFGFDYVNVKPISGHIAAMTVLISLLKRGDKIMAIAPELGGYDGYSPPYMADILGFEFKPLGIEDMHVVNVDDIIRERPKLVILGASYILFPYNLKEVLEVAEDVGSRVVYDASHVMGLIPSGFQKHIEKCDVVYGSTHKSFPGPQGGLILSNNEEISANIDKNLTWRTQDNYHTNRVASLALALGEFSHVAKSYGNMVASNSKVLAKELHDNGLRVKYSPRFTETHQILIDEKALVGDFNINPVQMSQILEKNGIIVDSVGRIGTAELTWKGYEERDMRIIGKLIIRAVKGENVLDAVRNVVKQWDGYTLGERYEQMRGA